MSAWDQPIQKQSSGSFKKTKWLTWATGYNYVRPLGEPHIVDTHYVQQSSVKCLGKEECPICKDNRQLWVEYGKESKNHGYTPISTRVFFNVIDRTMGKICPNPECGVEVKKVRGSFPAACPKCNQVLASVEAKKLNVVRVMNLGVTTFNKIINDVRPNVTDESGLPLMIGTYDIAFNSVGEGKERRSEPEVPETINTEKVTYNEEDLSDLTNCYLTVTAEEMVQMRKGMSVKDLFAARKGSSTVQVIPSETKQDIKDRIQALMNEE